MMFIQKIQPMTVRKLKDIRCRSYLLIMISFITANCAGVDNSMMIEEELPVADASLVGTYPHSLDMKNDDFSSELENETSACGNYFIEADETCDDGNVSDGDGCSSQCHLETASNSQSTNETFEGLIEESDEGSNENNMVTDVCGDGVMAVNEECDDGNLQDGDGCSARCTIESMGEISTDELTPDLTNILSDIPGYAEGTVGGKDGELYTVTSLEDDGPGTLREALGRDEALWVVFADHLNGVIRLESKLWIKSFKTIDARGHDITLQAIRDETVADQDLGWDNTGVHLGQRNNQNDEARDIVLLNLRFDGQWVETERSSEGAAAIHITDRAHHIWIHHCTFYNWVKRALSIKQGNSSAQTPHHITISNSQFVDINAANVIEGKQVTFARNECNRLNKDCIKAMASGSVHMINNAILNWSSKEVIYAKNEAQILVDHNIFKPRRRGESEPPGRESNDGRLGDIHNVRYGHGRYELNDRGSVSNSFKSEAQGVYGGRKVNCEHDPYDEGCWEDLYNTIRSEAGATI